MKFDVDVLFSGFSGKLETGYLGWGTWAAVRGEGHTMMLDTGFVGLRKDYAGILKEHGVDPADVDHVLLTHLHFDHAVNVDMYPNATFVVSQAEWDYATDPELKDCFIERSAVKYLKDHKLRLVNDGEEIIPGITAMLTPGHTPGCCSYVLDQGDGVRWVLAGDAVKNRGELRTGEVQMTLRPEESAASIRRIKEAGERILPGHDGWLTVKDGEVIAEGGNDKVLVFGQGVTVNGAQTTIRLRMD